MNIDHITNRNITRMPIKSVIDAAKKFGVPERYAIMRRLAFLQPHIKHLEREIWGAQRRIERSSDPLVKALTESFIRDQEKELRPLKREATALLNHVNGKETVLKANDSCVIEPNETREIINRGNEVCSIVVAVATPPK